MEIIRGKKERSIDCRPFFRGKNRLAIKRCQSVTSVGTTSIDRANNDRPRQGHFKLIMSHNSRYKKVLNGINVKRASRNLRLISVFRLSIYRARESFVLVPFLLISAVLFNLKLRCRLFIYTENISQTFSFLLAVLFVSSFVTFKAKSSFR